MRKDERLAGSIDKVLERRLDSLHELRVAARERPQFRSPLGQCPVDGRLDAECVGEAGVALAHKTLRVALELRRFTARRVRGARAAACTDLQVATRAALVDNGRAGLVLGTLGRRMAGSSAGVLADALRLGARLRARLALAGMARLLAAVIAAPEKLAADLSTGDTVRRRRAAYVLNCRVLATCARLGRKEGAWRAVGRFVTVVGCLGVSTWRVGAGAWE